MGAVASTWCGNRCASASCQLNRMLRLTSPTALPPGCCAGGSTIHRLPSPAPAPDYIRKMVQTDQCSKPAQKRACTLEPVFRLLTQPIRAHVFHEMWANADQQGAACPAGNSSSKQSNGPVHCSIGFRRYCSRTHSKDSSRGVCASECN